jgi:hypothetical protein
MSDPAVMDSFLDRSEWVRSYPAKRVCKFPGCKTRLSIYNPDEMCAAHDDGFSSYRVGFKKCTCCGVVKSCDEFGIKTRNRDGLNSQCRECRREADAASYRISLERSRARKRRWQEKKRAEAMSLRKDNQLDAVQRAQIAAQRVSALEDIS